MNESIEYRWWCATCGWLDGGDHVEDPVQGPAFHRHADGARCSGEITRAQVVYVEPEPNPLLARDILLVEIARSLRATHPDRAEGLIAEAERRMPRGAIVPCVCISRHASPARQSEAFGLLVPRWSLRNAQEAVPIVFVQDEVAVHALTGEDPGSTPDPVPADWMTIAESADLAELGNHPADLDPDPEDA